MSIEKMNTIWPEWKITQQLGEGSFGKVYKAVREEHGVTSTAAVKVISIPHSDAELVSIRSEGLDETGTRSYFEGIVTDFVGEIKLMESMKGTSNIVSVEDYKVLEKTDTIGWDIFIRMELLTSLNDYTIEKKLTEPEVIKLGQDVCSALELCAQRNVIHRDIKPENIFISSFSDFKVGDFGIARELEKTSGSLSQKGTYNYMAPEITTSRHYDATVDIYSLGLVLYKLMNNNRLPFLDPTAQLIQYQDRKDAIDRRFGGEPLPAPIQASPDLASIILAACAFNPAERYATPTAFKNALEVVAGQNPSQAPAALDVNATTAVRRAPDAANQAVPQPAQTDIPTASFGAKKKSGKKKFVISAAALVCAAAIAVAIFVANPGGVFDNATNNGESVNDIIGNTAAADVISALDDGDYSQALILAEEVSGDALQISLDGRLAELEAEFLAENIEFSVVTMVLDTIGAMDVPGLADSLSRTRNSVNSLNASRTAFNTGETFAGRGEYAQAIAQFLLVIPEDPNYSRARDSARTTTDAMRNAALSTAGAYSDAGDYERAVRILSDALLVIENDPEVTQQITIYRASVDAATRRIALDTASSYADGGDWPGAITTLNNALREMPGDSIITERLRSYEQSYVSGAIASADALVEQRRHDDALTLLSNVLQTLPNNTQITDEISRVEAIRPTSLASVVVVDSRHYGHYEDIFTDSFGNHHHESFRFNPHTSWRNYSTSDRTAYAVYNLDGNFRTFSADIVAPAGLSSYADFMIEITFEDNIIPVTSVDGINVRTGARRIEADVSGVTTITITVRVRDSRGHGGTHSIRLVNAELSG